MTGPATDQPATDGPATDRPATGQPGAERPETWVEALTDPARSDPDPDPEAQPADPAGPAGPAGASSASPRRRAWLQTAVVGLLVLIYLVGWSVYADVHTDERYEQRPPGAAGSRGGADFRVLSLVRSERLQDRTGAEPAIAPAGATFVVAELEVVRQGDDPTFLCAAELLGPGGRRWTPSGAEVERRVSYCRTDEIRPGQPYRFESVYTVPDRYADQLLGLALIDSTSTARAPVLTPPA